MREVWAIIAYNVRTKITSPASINCWEIFQRMEANTPHIGHMVRSKTYMQTIFNSILDKSKIK